MRRNFPALLYVVSACLLSGCTAPEAGKYETSAKAYIEVSATYRVRMLLPPDAELTATLEDVSLADAAAMRLGETRIKTDSAPPHRVRIAYDPKSIDDRNRYAVRVQIRHLGRLLMTSDTHTPVLTQGYGKHAELSLVSVP